MQPPSIDLFKAKSATNITDEADKKDAVNMSAKAFDKYHRLSVLIEEQIAKDSRQLTDTDIANIGTHGTAHIKALLAGESFVFTRTSVLALWWLFLILGKFSKEYSSEKYFVKKQFIPLPRVLFSQYDGMSVKICKRSFGLTFFDFRFGEQMLYGRFSSDRQSLDHHW